MKKKIFAIIMATLVCISMAACGGKKSPDGSSESSAAVSSIQQQTETPDLSGEWKQVNSNSEDSYQSASITGDTIEIYWTTTDSKSLYWAGTFTPPTDGKEPYTWDSKRDIEKTKNALLASQSDVKTFSYSGKQITYEVSALGTTQTVRLEKQQ